MIYLLAEKIKAWDREDVAVLRTMILTLEDHLGEDDKLEDYIDLSDLETEPFDQDLADYPVWARDKKGLFLVGSDFQIDSLLGREQRRHLHV